MGPSFFIFLDFFKGLCYAFSIADKKSREKEKKYDSFDKLQGRHHN